MSPYLLILKTLIERHEKSYISCESTTKTRNYKKGKSYISCQSRHEKRTLQKREDDNWHIHATSIKTKMRLWSGPDWRGWVHGGSLGGREDSARSSPPPCQPSPTSAWSPADPKWENYLHTMIQIADIVGTRLSLISFQLYESVPVPVRKIK